MLTLLQITLLIWAVSVSVKSLHQWHDVNSGIISEPEGSGFEVTVVMLNWERPQNVIRIGQCDPLILLSSHASMLHQMLICLKSQSP